jgi:hypothetical protein
MSTNLLGSTEKHHQTSRHPVSGAVPELRISQGTAVALYKIIYVITDEEINMLLVTLNETGLVTFTVIFPSLLNLTRCNGEKCMDTQDFHCGILIN